MANNKSKRKDIVLVDLYNTFMRSLFNVPISTKNGVYIGGVYGTIQSIMHIISALDPYRIIAIWDGRKNSEKRKKIYNNYKGERNIGNIFSALKYRGGMIDIEEAQKNFNMQLELLRESFVYMGISQIVKVNFVEADDIAGTIYKYLKNNNMFNDYRIIIYSTDEDWKQLLTDGNILYHPNKKEIISENDLEIYPQNIVYKKIIMGDKSDNISGVKGIGEKTLYTILPQLMNLKTGISFNEFLEYIKYNAKDDEGLLTENRRNMLKEIINDKKLKEKYDIIKQPTDLINLEIETRILNQFKDIISKKDFSENLNNLPYIRIFLMRNGICSAKRFSFIKKRLLQYYSQD